MVSFIRQSATQHGMFSDILGKFGKSHDIYSNILDIFATSLGTFYKT